jgi:hypothetical protein
VRCTSPPREPLVSDVHVCSSCSAALNGRRRRRPQATLPLPTQAVPITKPAAERSFTPACSHPLVPLAILLQQARLPAMYETGLRAVTTTSINGGNSDSIALSKGIQNEGFTSLPDTDLVDEQRTKRVMRQTCVKLGGDIFICSPGGLNKAFMGHVLRLAPSCSRPLTALQILLETVRSMFAPVLQWCMLNGPTATSVRS